MANTVRIVGARNALILAANTRVTVDVRVVLTSGASMRQIVAAQNVGTLEVSTPATVAVAFVENSVEFDSAD